MINIWGRGLHTLGGPGNPSLKSLQGPGFRAYPMYGSYVALVGGLLLFFGKGP